MAIFTVLILNQKTKELFIRYQSLFLDAIQDGSVGVCLWDETGTTVDTALPDLRQMTDDKDRWQALIVRTDNEEQDASMPADAKNPYDFFSESVKQEGEWDESKNPLIRLTHILGGAPPEEKEFTPREITDGDRKPYIVFDPVKDPERASRHRAFREKYEYDGVEPSSIILITMRQIHKFEEEADITPSEEDDLKSSLFWQRNRYPGLCRFIIYDYALSGSVQKTADDFQFWLMVRLMSTDRVDPAFLQAYRLYRGSVEVDKNELTIALRNTANRLNSTKQGLTIAIQKSARGLDFPVGDYPECAVPTPVNIRTAHKSECEIKPSSFGWFSRGANREIVHWENGCNEAERKVLRNVQLADRELDRAAEGTKVISTFLDDDVSRLDKYQREDLMAETDSLYERIIEMQGMLPAGGNILKGDVDNAKARVRRSLQERVGFTPVVYTLAFIAILLITTCIPAFIRYRQGSDESWSFLVGGMIGIFITATICCCAGIVIQKIGLNSLIRGYNRKILKALSQISINAEVYGKYLNAVTAHSRGKSYLEKSLKKERGDESLQMLRYRHIDAVNQFLTYVEQWSKAFHLDVDITRPGSNRDIDLDVMIQPSKNAAYAIHSDESYPTEINNSGMTISSPFTFVRRICLDREELYEDDVQ